MDMLTDACTMVATIDREMHTDREGERKVQGQIENYSLVYTFMARNADNKPKSTLIECIPVMHI